MDVCSCVLIFVYPCIKVCLQLLCVCSCVPMSGPVYACICVCVFVGGRASACVFDSIPRGKKIFRGLSLTGEIVSYYSFYF